MHDETLSELYIGNRSAAKYSYMLVRVTKKIIYFFSSISILAGCAYYQVPALTHDHPACPDISSPQIQLSSILEIDSAKQPLPVPRSHGVR